MNAKEKDRMEHKDHQVPVKAEPDSEIRARWAWTEPTVWTDRMLNALEDGIAGVEESKWFCLIDKVSKLANLRSAYAKTAAKDGAAGVDHVTVKSFGGNLEANLERMSRNIATGRHRPSRIKRVHIPKPGSVETRPLGIPTVEDRCVQTALRHVIEPIFERRFADNSYGFRPGRGCKDALREVDAQLHAGYQYVVDADLRKCFDRIPHQGLMNRVKEEIADKKVLSLIDSFLQQEVLEDGIIHEPETEGTPQGATLSPLLCNIYLTPLDHLMEKQGMRMVRYADDLVILCASTEEAERGLQLLQDWVEANGLELHPDKTRIANLREAGGYFDFLGYRFKRTGRGRLGRFPSPKSEKRLREKLRHPTRRCNGKSMKEIIRHCNQVLKGWYAYFKHTGRWGLKGIDGWVRMRLRSVLRKRSKRKGRGKGMDHQRWPNAYFDKLGLFSLTTAWAEEISPR